MLQGRGNVWLAEVLDGYRARLLYESPTLKARWICHSDRHQRSRKDRDPRWRISEKRAEMAAAGQRMDNERFERETGFCFPPETRKQFRHADVSPKDFHYESCGRRPVLSPMRSVGAPTRSNIERNRLVMGVSRSKRR